MLPSFQFGLPITKRQPNRQTRRLKQKTIRSSLASPDILYCTSAGDVIAVEDNTRSELLHPPRKKRRLQGQWPKDTTMANAEAVIEMWHKSNASSID
ncbi:hypothetical protein M422DRAFT_259869 [Sphaerobolus stellatus SS14]|uniref:Unplaced genomic scaffold SPHSTscaffold_93, whole genome shotgun sequence n=1 Tax=Sphaerobolus stellatus (strain SS14) TaxID=990650 RepID=A0A0C9VJH5_SPHS4|nr:hypothetical protein M422DRAFT_259869 [Sphaerobolus stellatus SS14]